MDGLHANPVKLVLCFIQKSRKRLGDFLGGVFEM